jgi:hypothetical protein
MSVTILREIRDACLYIKDTPHIGLTILMLHEMYSIACIGNNGIIPGATIHYKGLHKELNTYYDDYGAVQSNDSKNCVNRMKYRMKALQKCQIAQEADILLNTYKIDDCPCCYEEITNNNIVVLACDHLLCGGCVTKIKHVNNACPICRQQLKIIQKN